MVVVIIMIVGDWNISCVVAASASITASVIIVIVVCPSNLTTVVVGVVVWIVSLMSTLLKHPPFVFF